MNSAEEAAIVSIVLVPAVYFLLHFLRRKFPNASTNSQMVVIVIVTVIFLSICNLFPETNGRQRASAQEIIPRPSERVRLVPH